MSFAHEVIPAIMPASFDDIFEKAGMVEGMVSWVQVDVMDSIFVPSVSWPYDAEGMVEMHKLVEQGESLPYLDSLSYEIDLMVDHPEDEIAKWYTLGARRFLVHFESLASIDALEQIVIGYRKEGETEVGIAIGMETPIEDIVPVLPEVDCVQLMGIRKIGYQGEAFDEAVIAKVQHLRNVYKEGIISVDGGVSGSTAPALLSAGVNRLVSGSAIYKSENISQAIQKLQEL
jgi:ribulose-phosphate 3-epimerase